MFLLEDAKAHFKTGALSAAKVLEVPMSNRYMIQFALKDGAGYQPMNLASYRADVREFATLDAAHKVIREIGFRDYRVLASEGR